jgi:hypothetical protein
LETATSIEAGLERFDEEVSKAFDIEVRPAAGTPGGEFMADAGLNRTEAAVLNSIRTTVDAMSGALTRLAEDGDAETSILAANGRIRVHLDLLHLELILAMQRLAANQENAGARRAFAAALRVFLDQAKRSYMAD